MTAGSFLATVDIVDGNYSQKIMTMPAHFVRLLSLVGILFILLGGANEVHAQAQAPCIPQELTFPTSALRIPPNVKVGDVLYESTLTFPLAPGTACITRYHGPPNPYMVSGAANIPYRYGNPASKYSCAESCTTNNPTLGARLTLEIEDSPSSFAYRNQYENIQFTLPEDRTRALMVKARLQFIARYAQIEGPPIEARPRWFMVYSYLRNSTHYGNVFNLSYGTIPLIASTCNIPVVPTVMLDAVNASSFSGTGSVSRGAPKRFTIPLQCTGQSGAAQIGVSFSSAYRDASGAPGVIKTDQGTGMASGVGLKIVNETTRQPIRFDTLEPGPTPFKTTGTNDFPFSVQYFQTGAKITPGNVTGRVEVSIAYQ